MKRWIVLIGVVLCVAPTMTSQATSGPRDLAQSYLFTPGGMLTRLSPRVTYRASQFPLAFHVRPPDSSWWGAQWKSGRDYFRGGAPPNFGWIHLAHAESAQATPDGMVTIMTAFARTPTIAATVDVLRTRGRGASYDQSSPVTLAGYSGVQFDGRITGGKSVDHIGHFFVPFSPRSHKAKYYPDEYGVYGDVFRVIVLGVRGHTVVIYIENGALSPDAFPTFLDAATTILAAIHFPKGS
jgi:hypothetical protein